ncbi:MAG: hypothetical protein DMF64_19100 [Acidobacteria bacterium]|nr:MAG: hypothetical protein DMF64_19100 [Acidobacteriota bacterium]
MAIHELALSHYEAEKVLMPSERGEKIVEAVRVTVFGSNFPQRAVEPELYVGKARARRVSISRDERSLRGYFFNVPADGGAVRVSYPESQEGVLREPFARARIRPLAKECEGR